MLASTFGHCRLCRSLAPSLGLRAELLQGGVLLSLFLLTGRVGKKAQAGFKLIRTVDRNAVFAIVAVVLPTHRAIAGARSIASHSDGDDAGQRDPKMKSPIGRRESQILVVKLLDRIPALHRLVNPLRGF